jgi:hypothetical protein
MNHKKKFQICRKLKASPVVYFEDYLISKLGKFYYLDPKTEKYKDISNIIFDYTKKGVPIYRLLDLKDNTKFLEIRLDKLVLNTFIGDLEGKIIHKDGDYKNCNIDNLRYELNITKLDSGDSLWINNKEFKIFPKNKNYYISSDGIVYGVLYNKLLRKVLLDKLYYGSAISREGRKRSAYTLHRIVYLTWIGDIADGLTIDHKDGCKYNNHYNNLEAVSVLENVKRAHKLGLIVNRISLEDAHVICKMLEDNIFTRDIIDHFGVKDPEERYRLYAVIRQIRDRKIWKHVSVGYKIENYDAAHHHKNSGKSLNEKDVHDVCKLLQKRVPLKEIANTYGIHVDSVKNIMYKKTWPEITSNYTITPYLDEIIYKHTGSISIQQTHEVCKLIDIGMKNSKISKLLNIKRDIVKNIRSGRQYKNISKEYNFTNKIIQK